MSNSRDPLRRDKRAKRPVSKDDLPDEGYLNDATEARREHGSGWTDGGSSGRRKGIGMKIPVPPFT